MFENIEEKKIGERKRKKKTFQISLLIRHQSEKCSDYFLRETVDRRIKEKKRKKNSRHDNNITCIWTIELCVLGLFFF